MQENIQQSLSRLKQSLPLFQQDIGNIAWAFALLPNQEDLDIQRQEEIQQKIEEVQTAIQASTRFLNTSPQQFRACLEI